MLVAAVVMLVCVPYSRISSQDDVEPNSLIFQADCWIQNNQYEIKTEIPKPWLNNGKFQNKFDDNIFEHLRIPKPWLNIGKTQNLLDDRYIAFVSNSHPQRTSSTCNIIYTPNKRRFLSLSLWNIKFQFKNNWDIWIRWQTHSTSHLVKLVWLTQRKLRFSY